MKSKSIYKRQSVSLSEQQYTKLQILCSDHNLTMSEMMAMALEFFYFQMYYSGMDLPNMKAINQMCQVDCNG